MGRWITPDVSKRIREMAGQGYPRARIMAALHISPGQLSFQLKKMNLKTEKQNWGLQNVYRELQGRKI